MRLKLVYVTSERKFNAPTPTPTTPATPATSTPTAPTAPTASDSHYSNFHYFYFFLYSSLFFPLNLSLTTNHQKLLQGQ